MKYIKIHKEGRWIIVGALFLLFLLNMIVYMEFPKPILAFNLAFSAVLMLFVVFFFRNPRRVVEIDDPSLIVAPADGTVVVIEPVEEPEYFGDQRIQVSIFMSIFNVHANWYPVAGKVIKTAHHKGRHLAAYLPKASTENERSTVVIETPGKTQILVRQIAGALARRIVTYAHVGKQCHLNEHIGFIKFGSRVDLYLPLDAEIFVELGEATSGNETIIARLNE
ncbi:Phosphatidylserine decarboxylase proenzyme [uncultured Paludibacter sp.]|uniref:Phosphatidylserine decarboxylase proenzyme n=1 Tax=uncultured Paludibacter sp. TaxID=497635 RepID=A0A653AJ40_9BACT|nr:Phosphatidylserine decarboxylase proenzyme [uncultured Paludibacter sp.]